jgi:diadenosine tetraphosphate (Ap4A) HIT family hydrolase
VGPSETPACPECARLQERGRPLLRRGPLAVHGRLEPGPVPGWLVVAPQRHVEQLDALDEHEAAALGPLLRESAAALRRAAGGEKIYLAVFAELLPHLHVHVVARPRDWPAAQRGAALLQAPETVAPEEAERVTRRALELLATGALRPAAAAGARRSYKGVLFSALVCPGAGQLVQRQWTKGLLLVLATLAGTAWVAWRFVMLLAARLPAGADALDPLAWMDAWALARAEALPALAFGALVLGALWVYSIWDCYRRDVEPSPLAEETAEE